MFKNGDIVVALQNIGGYEIFDEEDNDEYVYPKGTYGIVTNTENNVVISLNRNDPSWLFTPENALRWFKHEYTDRL